MNDAVHVVAIVVGPEFGDRVDELLERMPLWMADTEANHGAAVRVQTPRVKSETLNHTAIGALTTFTVDPDSTPESWCLGIFDTSPVITIATRISPGYSGLEI